MAENPQQKARRHLAALIQMSPTITIGDDHFVYRVAPDGSKARFTSTKTNNQECFIVHEVLTTLPTGLMINPYAAPAGPDGPDAAVFYELMCRSLHSQLAMFLGVVNSALQSDDVKNNPTMLQYTQHIEDGGEKAFSDAVMALIKDPTWVSAMYNIHKQQGLVRVVPLYDKEDKDFVRFVKHKKARYAVHAVFKQLFDSHSGGFTGTPFGNIAPAGMTSRVNAFLAAYRAFVPNAYDLYSNAFGEELAAMLPNLDEFQEAAAAIDEDAPIVRFRKSSVPLTQSGMVVPSNAGAHLPMQPMNPATAAGGTASYNGYQTVVMPPASGTYSLAPAAQQYVPYPVPVASPGYGYGGVYAPPVQNLVPPVPNVNQMYVPAPFGMTNSVQPTLPMGVPVASLTGW